MKLSKLTAAGVVVLSVAAVAPVVAVAKDGGDDPPGDVRGGHGADDRATVAAKPAAAQAPTSRAAAARTLRGTVGPGFTITLKLNGKKVKTLKAGRYKFVIADRASSHNFELERTSGAEFEKEFTDVTSVGSTTSTLTLKKGKWKYYCKPHESVMRGFFTVK
jgi:plastocyanin